MDYTDRQITAAFELLGITQKDLARARVNPAVLQALQAKVRRTWKQAARELHPDRTGDDPQLTELFKLVKQVADEVAAMKVRPSRRRMKWALRMVRVEAS